MPDIRYVCLSDMHLGDQYSVLTNIDSEGVVRPLKASSVIVQLVECLKSLISTNENQRRPTLILNGDILEFALVTDNQAAMAFERFIELIMPNNGEKLFEKIIFIPGNHDHHLWESARETQYVNYLRRNFKASDELPIPWHATEMFVEDTPHEVQSFFLTNLVQIFDHLQDFYISTAYPNFGLISKDGQKCVAFHHGHFIESLYRLMTTMKALLFNAQAPLEVRDFEAENFAWIDFFWSTMGRSGEAGKDVEIIYEKMQNKEKFRELLDTLAENIAQNYMPGLTKEVKAMVLKEIFHVVLDKISTTERTLTDATLSEDAKSGLFDYLNVPLREQIGEELDRKWPTDITFVFGHTHKPYEDNSKIVDYSVKVYNSGGWVVETTEPQSVHGGAVILIDENLDTVSLRMYNEASSPEEYAVGVRVCPGEEESPFFLRIQGLVRPSENPWQTFSALVADEVIIRRANLEKSITN
jgi:hypothetical protein